MNVILISAAGIGILLAVVFLCLFRTVTSGSRKEALPRDLESIFTPSRYRPMERLLDPVDHEFLASQPSYSRRMGRRFRANRIAAFRGYARCLGKDFSHVSNALKALMIHASTDRSALAGLLLKQRLTFSYAMMGLEVKLALHSIGWSAPTVDVRELIGALDAMSAQLRALTVVAAPSAA
jgi:hypothetical protein